MPVPNATDASEGTFGGNKLGRRLVSEWMRGTSKVMGQAMPRAPRLPILLAIACALFLRALVPAGWMPAVDGGAFAIQPCPSAEPPPMAHTGHHGAKHDPSHHADHGGDCAFSAFSTAFASADQPVASFAPVEPDGGLPSLRRADDFKTGPPSLPPPSTGPPAIA